MTNEEPKNYTTSYTWRAGTFDGNTIAWAAIAVPAGDWSDIYEPEEKLRKPHYDGEQNVSVIWFACGFITGVIFILLFWQTLLQLFM